MAEQTIEIKPVQEEDHNEVMELIQKTYHIDAPLFQSVGLCVDGPCKELDEHSWEALSARLSFKAVDKDGNVVGTMVNIISHVKEITENDNPHLKMAEQCKNPKYQKILYNRAIREAEAKIWEKFPVDKQYIDVKIAGTHPDFRKRGIMNNLLKATENMAAQKGIELLRMATSNAYSAMCAERLGWTCIRCASYKDIKKDGQPILSPEAPHVDDRVYIKFIKA